MNLLHNMAKRDRLLAELNSVDAAIARDCRAYSDANGFRVPLRADQVLADMQRPRSEAA